jgi:26S proteasome regulatory subunit N1
MAGKEAIQPVAEAKEAKDVKEDKAALSEEDQALKERLDLLVQQLQETVTLETALEQLQQEVRGATTSMTSIPKPLKLLKPHYPAIKAFYLTLSPAPAKTRLANFLSVLAVTMAVPEEREMLKFLLEGDRSDLINWGQDYVRNLAGEIKDEATLRLTTSGSMDDLYELVDIIVPFLVKHSSEVEAVDLLQEVDSLGRILQHVDADNYKRVCPYIAATAAYAVDPEDMFKTLSICQDAYLKVQKYPEALRIALRINRKENIDMVLSAAPQGAIYKQLCYLLARQRYYIESEDEVCGRILSNEFMNEAYTRLARDLEVTEAKKPEDVYKSHLDERTRAQPLDSAKQNLAATIVNAFLNAGYGSDQLTTEDTGFILKNKDSGLMSAAASLGLILLWNVDEGLTKIDKYQYSKDDNVKAGAMMAFGIVNSGVKNECDPAFALLTESLESASDRVRQGIIAGLSFAYAGSQREDVLEILTPLVIDTNIPLESSALAALALGLVYVGTCNEQVADAVAQTLMERGEEELKNTYARYFALGIGLVFLGQQDRAQTILGVMKDFVAGPFKRYAVTTIESCAYAGSGNVLKIQELLQQCSEHHEEKEAPSHMAAALGVSFIAMGEDVGSDMLLRAFDHILQYGDVHMRKAAPLAIAALCIGDPKVHVVDMLTKLSHDSDAEVAQAAIFGLGICGAGTNNARIAGILRQLASYYSKDANQLFTVRISQGFVHMGKGLMTIQPYHSERFLMSPVALGGIMTVFHAMLDVNGIIHQHGHFLLYYLALAMYPRMLVTLDEEMNPAPVQVRVGQAVDVVGQAGHPRTITGFQTHMTPVLLAHGQRAELATEDYEPLTDVLENFVILRKVPKS